MGLVLFKVSVIARVVCRVLLQVRIHLQLIAEIGQIEGVGIRQPYLNAANVGMSEEEKNEYLKLYFKQPDDLALLYMNDLKTAVQVLSDFDLKQTEATISCFYHF